MPNSAHVIDLPGWRPIVKKVFTTVALVSALPMTVFYIALSLYGLRIAALTTMGLYCGALVVKLLRRKPILAAAVLTAGLLSIRTVVMFLTVYGAAHWLNAEDGDRCHALFCCPTAKAGLPALFVLERRGKRTCCRSLRLSVPLRLLVRCRLLLLAQRSARLSPGSHSLRGNAE